MPFRGERAAHKRSASVRRDHESLSSSHKLEALEDLRVVRERITTEVRVGSDTGVKDLVKAQLLTVGVPVLEKTDLELRVMNAEEHAKAV
ncbi:MAG: hypothetical protein ACXV2E_05420 [Halobacteriota archaeon]